MGNILRYSLFGVPLWVILLCGVLGVLVDLDHVFWGTRKLHPYLLLASSIVFCGTCAYLGGLFIRMVLGR